MIFCYLAIFYDIICQLLTPRLQYYSYRIPTVYFGYAKLCGLAFVVAQEE